MLLNVSGIYKKIRGFMNRLDEKHVSAYAAKTAYFIMLSFIPFLMLLFTMIQFTALSKADVMTLFVKIFPDAIDAMVISIIDEIYGKSITMISISAIVALWSAGKGITAIIQGLNSVFDVEETRNYIMLRIYGAFYTILMILGILVLLILVVFGNKIQGIILENVPVLHNITDVILRSRYLISLPLLVLIFAIIYHFMPNRKSRFKQQLPGAVFTAVSWSVFSFFFSLYIDYFSNMTNMYGSLTTLIVVMLWLYMCMYIMLMGAVINGMYMEKKREY